MNGGVGTLAEVSLAWSLMQVREIAPRPMILFGAAWQAFMEVFAQYSTIRSEDLKYLTFVGQPEAIVPALEGWWSAPPMIAPRLAMFKRLARMLNSDITLAAIHTSLRHLALSRINDLAPEPQGSLDFLPHRAQFGGILNPEIQRDEGMNTSAARHQIAGIGWA